MKSKWSNDAPKSISDRRALLDKCGRGCFLGSSTTFPICSRLGVTRTRKMACKIDRRGVQAAYSRARTWSTITARKKHSSSKAARSNRNYTAIARRAKAILSKMK